MCGEAIGTIQIDSNTMQKIEETYGDKIYRPGESIPAEALEETEEEAAHRREVEEFLENFHKDQENN